jgi:predicted esterase
MAYLPAAEMKSAAAPQASIIWLHGMGTDGSDFVPIARGQDEAWVCRSQREIGSLIAREHDQSIAPSRIVLAGFS